MHRVAPRLDLQMLPYANLRSAVLSPIPLIVLIDEKVMGQLQRVTNLIARVNKPDRLPDV